MTYDRLLVASTPEIDVLAANNRLLEPKIQQKSIYWRPLIDVLGDNNRLLVVNTPTIYVLVASNQCIGDQYSIIGSQWAQSVTGIHYIPNPYIVRQSSMYW